MQLKRRVRPVSQHLRWPSWTVEIKIQKLSRRGLPENFFSTRPLASIQLRGSSKISDAARSLGSLHVCHGWKCSSIEQPGCHANSLQHCGGAVEQHRFWISEGSFTLSEWGGDKSIDFDQASYKLGHVSTAKESSTAVSSPHSFSPFSFNRCLHSSSLISC